MISTGHELVQWNTDEVLEVSSNEEFNEVHFYNRSCKEALVVAVKEGKANIPNILLQSSDDITVWLVKSDGEGDRSIERKVFEVTAKKKPANYVYSETELITFKKLVEEVNSLVEDLEKKCDSGYFNGADGYTPQRGIDYFNEDDKAAIEEYIDGELAEMNATIADLRKLLIERSPFELALGDAENLTMNTKGDAYYMTLDTYGNNWRVSDDTTASVLKLDSNNSNKMRVFKDTSQGTFFRAMSVQKNYVFNFTASIGGTYSLGIKCATADSGGYADVYVNDVHLGYINTYATDGYITTRYFHGVELKSGDYANKIKIVPRKAEEYRNLVSIIAFEFTAPK